MSHKSNRKIKRIIYKIKKSGQVRNGLQGSVTECKIWNQSYKYY